MHFAVRQIRNMREIGSIGSQSLLDTINPPDHHQFYSWCGKLFHSLEQILDALSLRDEAHKQQAKLFTGSALGGSKLSRIDPVRQDSNPFGCYPHLDEASLDVVRSCQHQIREVDLVARSFQNPVNYSLVSAGREVRVQF